MEPLTNLKGIVLSRYKSVGEFAEKVGWGRNKASKILNGKQEPDAKDIEVLVEALQIESEKTFLQIFFPPLYRKWTEGKGAGREAS